ncbi:Nitroreductase family protein [Paenibacillus sp. 453mf]|nr:Nitroreductase family protein [Paenibacillus sp. 453mf]
MISQSSLIGVIIKAYNPPFADKPVPQDVLYTVLEAARWAPSSIHSVQVLFSKHSKYGLFFYMNVFLLCKRLHL